jgi:putative signal transducing protein
MPFCPECEAEYKAGITTCPDCNVELVGALTPATRVHDKEHGEPVPLQSFKNSAEAEMVHELLARNGVRSFVEGSGFAIIPGSFSQEVIVMVDERDLDQAVAIYEAYFDAESPAPTEEHKDES